MKTEKAKRFSKASMRAYLEMVQANIEKSYKFDHQSGWSQVEGRGEVMNRAYGEWNMCGMLLRQLDSI
jgi:hypothetical protein